MDEMEYPLWKSGEEPYRQHNNPPIRSVENRPSVASLSQRRFSARVPVVAEEAPNTRQLFNVSTGLGTAAAASSRLIGTSGGWGNPNGVKPFLGHRRSSRLQENILLRSQNMK